MKTMIKHSMMVAAMCVAGAMQQAEAQKMVIIGNDGSRTPFNLADIESVYVDQIQYAEANHLISASYVSGSGMATYMVAFGTSEPDSNGDPAKIGDFNMQLTMTAAPSAEAANAELPEGTYKPGNGTELMTFNASSTAAFIRDAEGDVSPLVLIGGTINVAREGDEYRIYCDLIDFNGNPISASYVGPIEFSIGASDFDKFEGHHDIQFTGGQCRFYGNWYYPFADDMTLQFYTGEFDANNNQTEGYWLNVDAYMPKVSDPKSPSVRVQDGVYKVDSREKVLSHTYLPFTFRPGKPLDFMGQTYPSGTYITYINSKGTRVMAYVTGGTITVSNNGTKFEFDLKAENDVTITGTCNRMYLQNFCDNKEPERPYSTLESDVTFEPTSDAVALAFGMGDYIIEGMESYVLMITDPSMTAGDYISLDIMSAEPYLSDGVYAVNNSLADKTIIKGCVEYSGTTLFSWYGDLDSTDSEGYQSIIGPIDGGTMTIENLSDGRTKFTFNLITDNNRKIVGSWTGKVNYASASEASASKATPLKAPRR